MNHSLRAVLALGWQSMAYGLGTIGSRIVVYFLLPFLTHSLPQAEFGAVSVLFTAYTFVNMLTFAGLGAATLKFYNEYKEEENRQLVIGSAQFLFFILAAIPAVIIIFFPKPVAYFLFDSELYTASIQYAAGLLVVDTLNIFGGVILRLQVRPIASSIHGTLLIAFETGLAVVFVTVYQLGVAGYWLGYLIGSLMGLMLMIWLIRKSLVFNVSRAKCVELLKFGLPLIPAGLSLTTLRLVDRYIIGSTAGLEQVAVYDIGYRIGVIVSLFIEPFRAAWQPFAFSVADKPEAQKIYRDILTYFTATLAYLTLGVMAFRVELVSLLSPESYAAATRVVSWVAVSQIFLGVHTVVSMGLMIRNRTRQLAWAGILAAVLNIILNYALIPFLGIVGAALATFVSYLALALITWLITQQYFAIPIDWMRMLTLLLVSAVTGIILSVLEGLCIGPWLRMGGKLLLLLSFPFFLLLTRFITMEQSRELWQIGKGWLFRKVSQG